MHRTTIFLDDTLHRRARRFARQHGKSFAALVREAVTVYVSSEPRSPEPPGTTSWSAGDADAVSEARPLFGRSRGRIRITGDLVAPIDADWDIGEDY